MTLDFILASLHHLLMLAIAAVIAFEIATIRGGMTREQVLRIARVDLSYGAFAAALVIVGFARAIFAAKGWAYYSVNGMFWAKIGAFALVGVISIVPTITILHWRRAAARASTFVPTLIEIDKVRRALWAEAAVFPFIPIFAAAMARGYG